LSAVLENKKVLSHLKSYKAIFLGGSAIPRTVLNKLIPHNFKIYSSYGLTEMASTVAIKYISGGDTSQAQILSGNTVKINNKKELLIKGPSLFSGYLINGKINKATDDEGWFHSKDLGEITDGKITVLGRVDNIFISGGENISPEEIEKELLKINGIYQAIVVPKKDKKYGERPVAFIELKSDLNEEIIKSHLKKHLPGFKIPVHILPWPVNRNSHALKINRNYFKTLIV
jgi:O-succinylbenzoic acid--CoA ligase